MDIDENTVRHIAQTANIHCNEVEIPRLVKEFKEILDIFDSLKKVDTLHVKPSFHPVPVRNNTRDDKVKECMSAEKAVHLAKHKQEISFLGPRAL